MVIVLLYKRLRDIKKAENIERSINNQAAASIQHVSPEKRAEIQQFNKQLEAAIASLKNSKIGKGKTGKAALYALPWYMIIGPSAAGKTTAIQNSGLDFPFGKEGFKGVGGTRNCDWFFSTQGIFLDTAGRYVTQTEDRAEWLSFLEVLKKNRTRKPINGIIAVINIDEVIHSDKDQLFEHAQNIRQRIDELIENLGITFPVYFMFTKCDLIQGFVDIFSDFSETERSQVWGTSFSSFNDMNELVRSRVETEFGLLTEKLFEIRAVRLSGPLKREQRRNVFLFPFQFHSLKDKVVYLLSEVFQHNPYQEDPLFRGFYFTSGTQEGVPLDLAIRAIAKQFDLQEQFNENTNELLEKKQYFIKDLLNDIVIGDKDFSSGQIAGVTKKKNTLRLAFAGASLVLLGLFGFLLYTAYSSNKSAIQKINNTAVSFASVNWDGNLLTNFRESENMLSLMKDIDNGDAVKTFFSFGMDRTDETKPMLEELYITKTKYFFTQNIYAEIEKLLDNYVNGQDYPGEEVYNYLRTYLLLGTERSRLDTTELKFVRSTINRILQSRYLLPASAVSSDKKDSLKLFMNNYIAAVTEQFPYREVYSLRNDNLLISLVRSRMQYQPGADNVYARLKQNGLNQFSGEISLETIISGRFTGVISSDVKIPSIFTSDGWKNYVQPEIHKVSRNPEEEDWVLGKQIVSASARLTSEEIRNTLVSMYLNDYKQNWLQLIQSIRYSEFGSVPVAAANMKDLSDPVNSPLITLLKDFAAQMQVISDISRADSGQTAISPSVDLTEVNHYKKFILAEDGSPGKELSSIMNHFATLSGVMESVKESPDLTKDYAQKVLSQRAIEFPNAMQQIKGALYNASALQGLFLTPVKLSWRAILSETKDHLNTQWKQKVSDVFNKSMAGSFPFNQKGPDIPMQDFKDFFDPQKGILWSFINQELAGFINVGRWNPVSWDNEGISISREAISALKKANDISTTLFRNSDLSVSFRLKPQIPESRPINREKPIVEQVYLSIDNVDNYYKMGASFWTDYTWPGSRGVPGARMNLTIKDYGSTETRSYDGEWALFRLFSDASIAAGETSTQYICNWYFKNENKYDVLVRYTLNAAGSKNPFSPDFFKSFRLPDKLN